MGAGMRRLTALTGDFWTYWIAPFFAGRHIPAHELERCGGRRFLIVTGIGVVFLSPVACGLHEPTTGA